MATHGRSRIAVRARLGNPGIQQRHADFLQRQQDRVASRSAQAAVADAHASGRRDGLAAALQALLPRGASGPPARPGLPASAPLPGPVAPRQQPHDVGMMSAAQPLLRGEPP